MGDTAWVAFGSAFGGAAVGGVLTAFGSYLVGSSERRRRARDELHLRLIPELRQFLERTSPYSPARPDKDIIDDIRHLGSLAGWRVEKRIEDGLATQWFLWQRDRNKPTDRLYEVALDFQVWLSKQTASYVSRMVVGRQWARFFKLHPEIPKGSLYVKPGDPAGKPEPLRGEDPVT